MFISITCMHRVFGSRLLFVAVARYHLRGTSEEILVSQKGIVVPTEQVDHVAYVR